MGIFDNLKQSVQDHLEKKKKEREEFQQLQREAENHRKIEFAAAFREDAFRVAKSKAKKDAAKLSGLQKLRAINRARRLDETGTDPNSFFSKLSAHTQRNMQRTEENKKRTVEIRAAAQQMKDEKMDNNINQRQQRMVNSGVRKPFGGTGFVPDGSFTRRKFV